MHYWSGEETNYNRPKTNQGKQRKLSTETEFLAVLMRLKVGLFVNDISSRLQISSSQFSRIFTTWIRLLRLELQSLCNFPSRFEVRHFLPPESAKYVNLRCLIDCTEFFIETPSSLTAQRETWSSYKSHNTCKVRFYLLCSSILFVQIASAMDYDEGSCTVYNFTSMPFIFYKITKTMHPC